MRDAREIAREIADGFQNMTLTASYRLECAIAAAIEQDRAEREAWLPIETAPRDGSTILIFGKPSDLVVSGDTLVEYRKAATYTAAWDEVDRAFCLSGGSWLGPFVEPTHWRPLPSPPSEESSS